ncbi:hypothetical protein [Mucilaginibacter rubeus]|uniref:Integrase catalytic domain-containing protein n=1 Tax=Mucilaginibacter rubeus TaxID=2027860 RepID=A0A5C1I6M1_9SPHI|nr:hypothetical protein [Mucilaginibacter rubeus]QEM13446.1 hypothetical protein DEO27_026700 [Mucilaginibacter rubeus]
MKYNDRTMLCLTYPEYVECFGPDTYKNDKKRGKLIVYGRGGNGSEVLIDFETLPADRKAKVIEKYGDPYQYVVKQPLTEWAQLNWNKKAFDFYNNYTLPNSAKLPTEYRDKYTKAVTYMDGIIYYTTDKQALKRDFNIKMEAFWRIAGDVIKAQNVALPSYETRLKERIKSYKKDGFNCLIETFRFSNDNRAKVKGQKAQDVLLKLIELDNKHSDEVIAASYNLWAVQNGMETITHHAVAYHRRNLDYQVVMAREGKAAAYSKYSKHVKQARPSAPLMLINSDDNVLDLYFKEVKYVKVKNKQGVLKNKKVVNNYWRPVMYVIIDCHNDYPLGYAVGETVTIELIKEACRNAIAHIAELTGKPHIWHQLKSDKWSIDRDLEGELATFFKMGGETIYFPAQVAQSKYIERVFGRPLHKVLKVFPNYSGANITATSVTSRPNTDALQKRAANFPDKSKAPEVIEMVINTMRHSIVEGTGKSRQEQWLEDYHASEFSKTRAISVERKLELVGVKHEPNEPVRLSVEGINFQLNKQNFSFDIPGIYFPEQVNKRVEIIYDPADMSQVLVTDNKGIRFVADTYQFKPSAIADYKEGDRARINAENEDKTRIAAKLSNYVEDRNARLQRERIDAQSIIQASVLTKAINHKAQKALTSYETPMYLENTIDAISSIYDEM